MNYTLTNTKDAPAAVTLAGTEKLLALVGGVVTTITPALIVSLSQPNLTGIGDVPGLSAALAAKANTADLPTNLGADFLRLELANTAPTPVGGQGFFWIGLGTHPNSWALFVRYNTGAKYRILDNLAANAIAGLPMDDDARDFERGAFTILDTSEADNAQDETSVFSGFTSKPMTVGGPPIAKFWMHLDFRGTPFSDAVIECTRAGSAEWVPLWTPSFVAPSVVSVSSIFENNPQVTHFRLHFVGYIGSFSTRPILRVIERL